MQAIYAVGGDPLRIEKLPIPMNEPGDDKLYSLGLSNDEEWLAYTRTGYISSFVDILNSRPTLGLLSRDGQIQEKKVDVSLFTPYLEMFYKEYINGWTASSTRWVGNQWIPMTIGLVYDSINGGHLTGVYSLLDPLRGEWHPEIYTQLPGWQPDYYVAFSPDMERALYASYELDKVILWDVEHQEILWQSPFQDYYFPNLPISYQWSLDGSRVVYMISLKKGITSILRDGTEVPLPILFKRVVDRIYYFISFSLSPDGKMIALRYPMIKNEQATEIEYQLFIYDFSSQRYILQCPIDLGNPMSWSPDSQFIAAGYYNLEIDETSNPLLVFDVNNGLVYQITDDGNAIDWSKNYPFINP